MSVMNRRVMVRYSSKTLPSHQQGVCECGHQFHEGEVFLGYPAGDGSHWFVCLTCHFWKVYDKAKRAS